MALIMFFLPMVMTYNQQIAHASIVSKPLTITAKKVAKDLAQNAAVEMAEHILFEKAINDFINSDKFKVDEGYKAVCLDGFKSVEDCPPNKRAQVKENLTSSDKAALSKKVESVLEQKTNTSSKWGKFLDWFIPVFLVSGLVATFDSMMDSESEGLIDDIAQQALLDSGLLKELNQKIVSDPNARDFTNYIESVTVAEGSTGTVNYNLKLKTGAFLQIKIGESTYVVKDGLLQLNYTRTYHWEGGSTPNFPKVQFNHIAMTGVSGTIGSVKKVIYLDRDNGNTDYNGHHTASDIAVAWWQSNILAVATYGRTVNETMNGFLQLANMGAVAVSFNAPFLNPPRVPVEVGQQTGVQHLKKSDGTVTVPGIDSFTYTYNNTYIYPSPDSTTGWKEKTTGEDIVVIDDDVAVDTEIDTPIEDDKEEEFPSCSKKLEKIKFNKVGTAFTNAFPFSIPWDIKRFIDASFGGVGDARPSFKLPDSLGGSKIELPAYFDSWVSFGRTFIVISFDLALVFLFYRFMRGGGD